MLYNIAKKIKKIIHTFVTNKKEKNAHCNKLTKKKQIKENYFVAIYHKNLINHYFLRQSAFLSDRYSID